MPLSRSLSLLLTMCLGTSLAQGVEAEASARTIAALQACTPTTDPEMLYTTFSDFCRVHFGAEKEPLVYDFAGKELKLLDEGTWIHVSENSAVIAFESSLPAVSTVSFGEGAERMDQRTEATDRPYYLHVHTLRGLKPGTVYHYQPELTDERQGVLRVPTATFTTKQRGDAIGFPAAGETPPYQLNQAGKTYVLTQDITTVGTAIEVIGDDITLDLNGHTVRFAEGATAEVTAGIIARGTGDARLRYLSSGFKLFNGTVIQGQSPAIAANTSTERFLPILVHGADPELAGIQVEYHGPQTWGIAVRTPSGKVHIHHNVVTDKGGVIINRHGSGTRAISFLNTKKVENDFEISRNLIRRSRQNGIGGASRMFHNEVYIDSYSTNSFAIQPNSAPGVVAGTLHGNRVFGTGFNAYGFGWAHESLHIHDNLVHFHGFMANSRWAATESWGDMSTLEAMRVTNYGKGGQVRNDLRYWNNLIVLRGSGGCELRGTGFFSDTSIADLVFHDNIVKVTSDDDQTTQVACIVAHGHTNKTDSLPVLYRDNTLIGNLCHIRFGDSYGKGHNHHFVKNTLTRIGERPDYHAVILGGAYTTAGHRLIDCIVDKSIDLFAPFWQKTSLSSNYAVEWTLDLEAEAGAKVEITDASGANVFSGAVPADGRLRIPLTQAMVHPPAWPDGKATEGARGCVPETKTPHRVTVHAGSREQSKEVTMDQRRELRF